MMVRTPTLVFLIYRYLFLYPLQFKELSRYTNKKCVAIWIEADVKKITKITFLAIVYKLLLRNQGGYIIYIYVSYVHRLFQNHLCQHQSIIRMLFSQYLYKKWPCFSSPRAHPSLPSYSNATTLCVYIKFGHSIVIVTKSIVYYSLVLLNLCGSPKNKNNNWVLGRNYSPNSQQHSCTFVQNIDLKHFWDFRILPGCTKTQYISNTISVIRLFNLDLI